MIQIICTVLTFVGALLLLALNQWFAARHKQTEVLSGKLEELYRVIERIGSMATPDGDREQGLMEIMRGMRLRAREALKECKAASLLIALYFPQLEARWNETLNAAEAVYCEMLDFGPGSDFDYIWGKSIDVQDKAENMLDHLTIEAGSLTKRVFS